MNTLDHLNLIKLFCLRNLEIAAKRTPGEWQSEMDEDSLCGDQLVTAMCKRADGSWYQMVWKDIGNSDETQAVLDADFIATCAGAAEAGWKATIAAIEHMEARNFRHTDEFMDRILAAYPLTLIQR